MVKTVPIADGQGVVQIRRRRATVRVRGQFVAQVAKIPGTGWTTHHGDTFPSAVDAAEDLADDAAYGRAA